MLGGSAASAFTCFADAAGHATSTAWPITHAAHKTQNQSGPHSGFSVRGKYVTRREKDRAWSGEPVGGGEPSVYFRAAERFAANSCQPEHCGAEISTTSKEVSQTLLSVSAMNLATAFRLDT